MSVFSGHAAGRSLWRAQWLVWWGIFAVLKKLSVPLHWLDASIIIFTFTKSLSFPSPLFFFSFSLTHNFYSHFFLKLLNTQMMCISVLSYKMFWYRLELQECCAEWMVVRLSISLSLEWECVAFFCHLNNCLSQA